MGIKERLGRWLLRNVVSVETLSATGAMSGCAIEVDAETARTLSAVDACISILSSSMSKLPNFVMNEKTRERIEHPVLKVLNIRPNEAMTPAVRKKMLETSRLEGGNAYDWILRDPYTLRVKELIPVPWWMVQPWYDEAGHVWYTVTHPITGEPMVLPNEDVCHYKNETRTGLKGIPTLRRAAEVIAAARAAQQYNLSYYQNGGSPSGVLQTDSDLGGKIPDPEHPGETISKKEKLRREWERVHSGPKNSHRIAILDYGLKYQPLTISNSDAQFVQQQEAMVKDVARFFGVPLYKLQEGHQAYGSNEQNAIEYVVGTLHPIVSQYEEEQTWKLLTDTEIRKGLAVRINMMAELKGDTTARGSWFTNMRNNGAFSVNDIRALEDLPDVAGGDERMAPLSSVPLSQWAEITTRQEGAKNESNTERNRGL